MKESRGCKTQTPLLHSKQDGFESPALNRRKIRTFVQRRNLETLTFPAFFQKQFYYEVEARVQSSWVKHFKYRSTSTPLTSMMSNKKWKWNTLNHQRQWCQTCPTMDNGALMEHKYVLLGKFHQHTHINNCGFCQNQVPANYLFLCLYVYAFFVFVYKCFCICIQMFLYLHLYSNVFVFVFKCFCICMQMITYIVCHRYLIVWRCFVFGGSK